MLISDEIRLKALKKIIQLLESSDIQICEKIFIDKFLIQYMTQPYNYGNEHI
jgi:hypothetical protein